MKPDAATADRRQSVREAGREWFHAGWIDEIACKSIAEIYPDDRVRVGPVFRILFFVLTLAAIMGAAGALYSLIDHEKPIAVLALAGGLACWATANYLIGPKKRRQGGIEAAFSLAAIVNLMIGLTIFLFESHWMHDRATIILLLFLFALLFGAAAWVWGYWPYMALSAALLFFAVITLPAGRLLWIMTLAADLCMAGTGLRFPATATIAEKMLGRFPDRIDSGSLCSGQCIDLGPTRCLVFFRNRTPNCSLDGCLSASQLLCLLPRLA